MKLENMVEQAAEDYAKYFQHCGIEKEINPICLSIEEMLARLDEFETLLSNVKSETNSIMQQHIISTINYEGSFLSMRDRIDKLEEFIEVVNENVNAIEKSVDIAEEELNITDYSLKGILFKPLFSKAKSNNADSDGQQNNSNLVNGEFKSVPIFKTDEYFEASPMETEDVIAELQPIEEIFEQKNETIR